ncbi:cyclase family protein [Nocardiopsis sp. NPDC050513]|uniref:cyclase family protein n=1 Tax=Nocardiopsis sp. NPDC050513 TaxID=3364338 RepID=UPI003795B448
MCSPAMVMAAIRGEGQHVCSHHPAPATGEPTTASTETGTPATGESSAQRGRVVRSATRPGSPRGSSRPGPEAPGEPVRSGGATSRRGALRAALAGGLGVAGAGLVAGEASATAAPTGRYNPIHRLPEMISRGSIRMKDLTHELHEDFPVFAAFVRAPEHVQVMFEDEVGFNTAEWTFNEHSGTHIDVPAHWQDGMPTVDEIRLEDLVAPLAVIRIADRAAEDNVTGVTVRDIRRWERRHGRLPERAFVAMDSGWAARVGSSEDFLNIDPVTGAARFPGFTPEAADFLVGERGVVGLGVDTPSLDIGADPDPQTHSILLTSGHYGLENLAALDQVPDAGATLMVGVPRLKGGFGAPVRAMALV